MLKVKWFVFLVLTSLVGCDSSSQSDTPTVAPALQQAPQTEQLLDIEPLLEMHGDVVNGKRVAQQECSECHGTNGVTGHTSAPFIAGQPYEYLLLSMAAYVNEQRDHHAMKQATHNLDSNALVDVARYYASLTSTKWDPSVASARSGKIVATTQMIAEGERLSDACFSCHGKDGVSIRAGFPSLAGMHAEYFVKTIDDAFRGERKHQIMEMFKESVSKHSAEALAVYYASLKPKKTSNPVLGDVKAGAKLAADYCSGCHGIDGNSITPSMPSLAGQDAQYLTSTTMDYREGARKDSMMAKATKGMSDQQITDLSAFYAKQRPAPYVRVVTYQKDKFNPMADAGKMAKSCNGCHGIDGNSKRTGMPSLTGLTPEYLVASTLSYRNGGRQHQEMKQLVEDLSALDIEKISLYYATRNTQSSAMTGKGDVAEGEKQSAICAGCHDKQGADPLMPSLAGQNATYTIQASEDYINGKRNHKVMRDAVVVLPKEVLANIAAYYATQKPTRLDIRMPEAPAILAAGCDSCHGHKGRSNDPMVPRLAGQVEFYLAQVLREYGNGTRTSSPMHVNSIALTHLESGAIASYYSAQ